MSKQAKDTRLVYEPPRAMRMADTHAGAGDCEAPGSGDADCVPTGNSATAICRNPGNSASGNQGCGFPGNTAIGNCENGIGVIR